MMKTANMPHALLIFPPVYDFALFDLFIKPFPLLTIGKSLERAGYRVSLLNCLDYTDETSCRFLSAPRRHENGTGKFFKQHIEKPVALKNIKRYYSRYGIITEEIERRVSGIRPDIVLVTTGMTYWYPGVREAVRIVRKYHPRVKVIAGGTYATLCSSHCIEVTGADEVISGPASPRLGEVCGSLGLPVPDAPHDSDLLILSDIYSDAAVLKIHSGCPFRCRYCASSLLSGDFHNGDPASAFALLRETHGRLGTRVFAFYDDALLADRERGIIPFLHMVCDSGLNVNFYLPNGIHLRYLDTELAVLMKKAGFREIRIGIESMRPDFHRSYDNKVSVGALGDAVDLLKKAGFGGHEIGCYILAGLPGQYSEDVEESVRTLSRYGVRIYIAEFSPVPGTPIWKECVRTSVYPLEEEPLFHNNSIFPFAWKHFRRTDLESIKRLARSLSVKE
ncbi:MAG: radical SAM protein [Spirochaetales bacterium]|nr:radical SAM protein [Spirochaetales bacterium]